MKVRITTQAKDREPISVVREFTHVAELLSVLSAELEDGRADWISGFGPGTRIEIERVDSGDSFDKTFSHLPRQSQLTGEE